MNPLEFIVFFMLLSLVSSIFTVSFHNVTRYYIEVQPDGKEIVKGYIGKYYSYFIEKIVRYEKRYYVFDTLFQKISELKKMLPAIGNKICFPKELSNQPCFITNKGAITEEEIFKIETILSCKVETKSANSEDTQTLWFFYIEEPIYLFPSWIRKPLSQCVVCMSSVFGSGIWLFVNLLYNPLTWASNYYLALFGFLFIFIVVLSLLNDIIQRKSL